MKVFVVLCLVASAVAFPGGPLVPGIAFLEDMRTNIDSRIIQGWPAVAEQFPHQAFLITSDNAGSSYSCGGSLISTSWVITAAHCVYAVTSAQVHLGSITYSSSPVIITTRSLTYHSNYNRTNLNNDIGLIDLGQTVTLNTNIQTIKIDADTSDLHEGKIAFVSGFGLTVDGGSISPTLNFVNMTVLANTVCADTFGASIIISSTICGNGVTTMTQGPCGGDSGGPLILRNTTGDTLIGIASFRSSAGCVEYFPSGFVRPNFFTSWITSVSGIIFS